MNKTEVKISHNILLDLLIYFHNYCEENNLKYYIIGGTLLGAVRHGGFIPWDIDADVAMPRKDYEKFLEVSKNNFQSEYFIQNIFTEKNFHTPKTKILVRGAKKNNPSKYMISSKTGLNLDIFPLDYAPDDVKKRSNQRKQIKFYKTLLRFKINYHIQTNGFASQLKKVARNILRLSLLPLSEKYLVSKLTNIMTKYNNKESSYLCSMASHYDYFTQVMEKEMYGEGKLIDFEGYKLFAPDMVEEYLVQIYGEYMKIPSLDQQEAMYKDLNLFLDDKNKSKYFHINN